MKAYNKYMDNISVSSTLHQKIMSRADDDRPKRWPIMIKRYAAAFACLAVVLLSIVTIPQLTQSNVLPMPGDNPLAFQPGTDSSTPGISKNYMLIFNKAGGQTADKIYIPGHFWQKLTDDELQAIFPSLTQKYSVTATANFQSDKTGVALFSIDTHAVSTNGLETYIQIAPDKVVIDRYMLGGDVKTSDVLGTAVTTGCFETKPNNKGLRNVIYFASFKLSGIAYYVELGGREKEKEALQEEISGLLDLLVKGGPVERGQA